MKKTTIKSLLLGLLMTAGASSAWAENWSVNLKGLVTSDAGVTISSEETVTIGGTTLGTISYNSISIDSKFVLQTGTSWLMRAAGLYQFNSGGRSFGLQDCTAGQIITITASGDPNVTTNATLRSSSGGTYVYTVTDDGGVKFTPARYLYFYTISVEDPAADNVSYTVKYVDEEGNSIKDDATYDDAPGAEVSISDVDKANIVYEGVTYIYKNDDSEGKTVAADGTTVVTLVFRVANTFSYAVNEVFGESILNTTEGSGIESTRPGIPFHQYHLVDGVLYTKGAINKEFNYYFTLSQDAQIENLDYTATNINNVVYFSEAEDIEGMTRVTGSNANVRCSMAAGGYNAGEEDIVATTLEPGTYQIVAQVWGGTGSSPTINCGEISLECPTLGYLASYTSDEFTLTEAKDVTLPMSGANGKCFDWIYIVKVPVKYSYKVSTSNGTVLAEGIAGEGSAITVPYPQYELVDGTLYTKPATNKEYNYTFTLLEDSEITLDYTATDITDVVYFSEGENIDGATATSAGNNMKIRSSNAACGYAESDITLISLPAGRYKAVMVSYSNSTAGLTEKFQFGEEAYEVVIEGSSNWYGSEKEFTLTETADVQWLASGDTKNGLDYIYIVKQPDVLRGDADGSGNVDISDVVAVVNYILNGGATGAFVFENADVDGSGIVDISDVVGVVNIILNGE